MTTLPLAPIAPRILASDCDDLSEWMVYTAPLEDGTFVTRVFGGLLDGQAHGSPDADSALRRHAGQVASCMKGSERRPGS